MSKIMSMIETKYQHREIWGPRQLLPTTIDQQPASETSFSDYLWEDNCLIVICQCLFMAKYRE